MFESNYKYINDLVDKVKAGDMAALYHICDYYQPLIKASIARVIRKDSRFTSYKEDLYTEVFLIFKYFCEQFDSNLSYFSYFVSTRIDAYLINKVKQLCGVSDKVTLQTLDEIHSESPSSIYDPFNKFYDNKIIETCVNELPQDLQIVIDYYYYQNLNQQQCAELLDMSQPTFCRRLKKALKILKLKIPADFVE